MAEPEGTTIATTVSRVVDGDTVVVPVEGRDEHLRLLCLDTEESRPGGNKPDTPWGRRAKDEATALLPPGEAVTLEFPGTESVEVGLRRHRDNFGRLLVFLYFGAGDDFQEHMIRAGYSPYFSKYGHAAFDGHRRRYVAAERAAQAAHIGVWDQVTVNGSEMRNYATLGVWWELRAALIDDYRARRAADSTLLNSRLDYEQLHELSESGQEQVTVFTELAGIQLVGQRRAVVDIGSRHQPFKVFIPDIETAGGEALLSLLGSRYLAGDPTHVRRSYAYVSGLLTRFRDEPEVVVTDPDQIVDTPA
ncbi:MAG: thermonuclease family protein [Egibacteraceae bacterium]